MAFKILLLYPPQSPPGQPYSSLPCLTACLRQHGYVVVQKDINIEAYDSLLTAARLQLAADRVSARLHSLKSDQQALQEQEKLVETYLKADAMAPHVIEQIEAAKAAVRNPASFYDLDQSSRAFSIIQRGLDILSAEHHPTRWKLDDFKMRGLSVGQGSPTSYARILDSVHDQRENLFLSFFQDQVMPQVVSEAPDLVGLSVTYSQQIVPALTLASLIRQAMPGVHICVGGARVCYDKLWTRPQIFDLIDSVVMGEGETALLTLVRKVEQGSQDYEDAPNLVYRVDGQVRSNPIRLEDVNALPTPDWSGHPFDKYFSPDFMPMLPTARGCFWKKCAFCTVSQASSLRYRARHVDRVVEDMRVLHDKHGARHFFLSTDAEPPKRMKELAQRLKEEKLPFYWQSEARLSPPLSAEDCRLLAEGGCRYLIFGLESANQRVLNLMEKGTDVAKLADVVRNCHQAGIGVNLQAFIGFPTETAEEAQDTVDFLVENRAYIDSVSVGYFMLQPSSKVDAFPERYGITHVERFAESDVIMSYDYQASQGLQQSETPGLLQKHLTTLTRYYEDYLVFGWLTNMFLYVSRYGLQEMRALKKAARKPMPELLQRLIHVPDTVVRRPLSTNGASNGRHFLFSPTHGAALTAHADDMQLLSLCTGRLTLGEIGSQVAGEAESVKDFIAIYARTLQRLSTLVNDGLLEAV